MIMLFAIFVLYLFSGCLLVMSNIEIFEEDYSDSMLDYIFSFFLSVLITPLILILVVLGLLNFKGEPHDER